MKWYLARVSVTTRMRAGVPPPAPWMLPTFYIESESIEAARRRAEEIVGMFDARNDVSLVAVYVEEVQR